MIVRFVVLESLHGHRSVGATITAILLAMLAGGPWDRSEVTASDPLQETTSRPLRSSAGPKPPFDSPPLTPVTTKAGATQRLPEREPGENTIELVGEVVAPEAAAFVSDLQEPEPSICRCRRCTTQTTPQHRTGYPHRIANYARPSVNPHYGGYFVGGGAPRRTFGRVFGGAETRDRSEGTWGWDYRGPLSLRRVALQWWHGRRQQAGTGSYATERMGGRRHSSGHSSDHSPSHSSEHSPGH